MVRCGDEATVATPPTTTDTGAAPETPARRCGCDAAGAGPAWALWLAVAAARCRARITPGECRQRRRRRDQPAEKELVTLWAGSTKPGTAFGGYHAVVGLAALPAGLWFGAVAVRAPATARRPTRSRP